MIIKVRESHRGFELDPLEVRLREKGLLWVGCRSESLGWDLNQIKGLGPPWVSTGPG